MKSFVYAFSAGEAKQLPGGNFLILITAGNAVNIDYYKNGQNINESAVTVIGGYYYRNLDGFDYAQIYSPTSQNLHIAISRGDGGYNVASTIISGGTLNTVDNVANVAAVANVTNVQTVSTVSLVSSVTTVGNVTNVADVTKISRVEHKNSSDNKHFNGMLELSSAASQNILLVWNAHPTATLRLSNLSLTTSTAGINVVFTRVTSLTGFTLLHGAENKTLGSVSADILNYYRTTAGATGVVMHASSSFSVGVANQAVVFPINEAAPINIPALNGLMFSGGLSTMLFRAMYDCFYD